MRSWWSSNVVCFIHLPPILVRLAGFRSTAGAGTRHRVPVARDAGGTQVYTHSLGENGTFQTLAGTAGAWSIEVTLSGASGNLNFRAQKP